MRTCSDVTSWLASFAIPPTAISWANMPGAHLLAAMQHVRIDYGAALQLL
jgi:hypothetical protein